MAVLAGAECVESENECGSCADSAVATTYAQQMAETAKKALQVLERRQLLAQTATKAIEELGRNQLLAQTAAMAIETLERNQQEMTKGEGSGSAASASSSTDNGFKKTDTSRWTKEQQKKYAESSWKNEEGWGKQSKDERKRKATSTLQKQQSEEQDHNSRLPTSKSWQEEKVRSSHSTDSTVSSKDSDDDVFVNPGITPSTSPTSSTKQPHDDKKYADPKYSEIMYDWFHPCSAKDRLAAQYLINDTAESMLADPKYTSTTEPEHQAQVAKYCRDCMNDRRSAMRNRRITEKEWEDPFLDESEGEIDMQVEAFKYTIPDRAMARKWRGFFFPRFCMPWFTGRIAEGCEFDRDGWKNIKDLPGRERERDLRVQMSNY